ncbi:hypothetical protein [Nonomuraea endophytica]
MITSTPATTPDEFDLDVRFAAAGATVAEFNTEDCTSDDCGDTSGEQC